VIRNTFQLIPGVGPWRERDLWARGILTWDDFPLGAPALGISRRMDAIARARIEESRAALANRDLKRLAGLIPPREHWRLYAEFQNEAAFFDIETEGRSPFEPTVASVFDRRGVHAFIRGRNLDQFPQAMAESRLWVSFPVPSAHLDLRFACRRMGLPGGLKQIEDRLGFGRPAHLRGVDGWDAVILWRIFRRDSDLEALRFLVEYNLYDSLQLKTLVEKLYNRGVDLLGCEAPRVSVFDRGDVLYDLSKLLLGLGPAEREGRLRAQLRTERRVLA